MSSAHDLDDDAALAAWREGDRAAGQLLFTRYYQPVARFFLNKVGEASPDLIQRTFLACVEGKDKFRGEGSFRSYVFAVAYRQLCGHYRSRYGGRGRLGDRVVLEEVSIADLEPSLSGMLVEQEETQLFLAALRRLPMELQVLLELHYWERCKISEMARVFEVPEGTIKSRLRLGRNKLSALVEELATSPRQAASTLAGLETWAARVREKTPKR